MLGRAHDRATRLLDASPAANPAKRMLVLVNPRATRVDPSLTETLLKALARHYHVDCVETRRPGHATALSRDATNGGYDIVTAFGGDGTVNEVANGLAGTDTPLTCLPGGRTNVFARALGIPRDVVAATDRLIHSGGRMRTRRIDTGLMNGRHFVFASGVGFGATLNARFNDRDRLKARLGEYYFAYEMLASVARSRPGSRQRVRTTVDRRSVEGVTTIAQNSQLLTYFGRWPVRVCENAGLATGTISLAVLKRASFRELLTLPPRAFSDRPSAVARHEQVESFPSVRAARVDALGDERFPVEIDGEYVGDFDAIEYGIAPRSLCVAA